MAETTTRRAKKSKVDPNESREQKFVRLARTRGDKLVHQINLLSNLGTSYAYEINSDLAEELMGQFEETLNSLKQQWQKAIDRSRKGKKDDSEESTSESESAEKADEPVAVASEA